MAAGSRKSGVRSRANGGEEAAKTAKEAGTAATTPPSSSDKAEGGRWVERPMEPVVARGRGMHVLGFMPLRGLPMRPLFPAAKTLAEAKEEAPGSAKPKAANDSRVDGRDARRNHDGYSCQHGNYRGYYGYRRGLSADGLDPRLSAVTAELGDRCFAGREVLDIGCNTGEISLAVARHLGARRVVGVDIDEALVSAAQATRDTAAASTASGAGRRGGSKPCEIEFRAEDFVAGPLRQEELFDAVLCLSVTKWVHFSRGDSGIRKLFRRVLKRLRPGGLFILEPQEWSSYKKKRHLTPEIRQTVAGIEMKPEAFDEHLLSLGFESAGVIAPPNKGPKGFQRSIRLYRKPREEGEEEEAPEREEKEEAAGKASKSKQKKQKDAEVEGGDLEEEASQNASKAKQRRQKCEAAEVLESKGKAEKKRPKAADELAGEAEEAGEEEEDGRARRKAEKRRRKAAEEVAEEEEEEQDEPARRQAEKRRRREAEEAKEKEEEEEELDERARRKAEKRRRKAAAEEEEAVAEEEVEEKERKAKKQRAKPLEPAEEEEEVAAKEEEKEEEEEEQVVAHEVEDKEESNEPVALLRKRPRKRIDLWA